MFYTIYKVTNTINGKYYIGKHQSKTLMDNYMGSGELIRKAIKKYGIENFEKEILYYCESLEDMNNKEKEILNEDHVKNPQCYNQKIGGEGGWDHWLNTDAAIKSRQKGGLNSGVKERNLSLSKDEYRRRYEIGLKQWLEENGNRGNPLTQEEKILLSQKVSAEKNPMYNRVWIHKDGEFKTIPKNHLSEYESDGWNRGRRYRKINASNYGRKWVNNGTESKLVTTDQIANYLNNGYNKGRMPQHTKFTKDMTV